MISLPKEPGPLGPIAGIVASLVVAYMLVQLEINLVSPWYGLFIVGVFFVACALIFRDKIRWMTLFAGLAIAAFVAMYFSETVFGGRLLHLELIALSFTALFGAILMAMLRK